MANNKKIPLLKPEDIEIRYDTCTKAGVYALLYKTARTDYRILDEVYGQNNWQIDYQEIKGNLYCTISLWDEEKKQWIRKTNCGIESRGDGDGNEKKGEASDAAKRAGTVVGIGRELYSAPAIFLEIETTENNGKFKPKNRADNYMVTTIECNDVGVISKLVIANKKTGTVVFNWNGDAKTAKGNKTPKTAPKEEKPQVETNTQPKEEKASEEPKMAFKDLTLKIGNIAKKISAANGGKLDLYHAVVEKVTGDKNFKCNKATEADYSKVFSIYKELVAAGYDK